MEKIKQFQNKIELQVDNKKFVGYNPYDLLASPYLSNKKNFKFLMYLTQLYRILPINIRNSFKINKLTSPKAYGLLLSAFCKNNDVKGSKLLVDELIKNKSNKYKEYSIGFPFPIILSWYKSPENYPSLIITLFVMYGFIDYYKLSKDASIYSIIIGFVNLIEKKLPKKETENELWYSYTFDSLNEVYNATAKVGKFYSKLYSIKPEAEYLKKINKILTYLKRNQRIDGSWAYDNNRNYSDGFHTAFILEAINEMLSVVNKKHFQKMFDLGITNYCENFFLKSSQPLYYHPKYKPKDIRKYFTQTDIRDCAMAIILFSKIEKKELAQKVLKWTINNMYNKKHKYFYQYKDYLWKNKIEFIRPQAWMYYAISLI